MAKRKRQTGPVKPDRQSKSGHVWAVGQLAHHFHGTYWASIALQFDDADSARDACVTLGKPWEQSAKFPQCLACHVEGQTLEHVAAQLESYGADRKLMGSLRFSVDVGEPFGVLVPVTASEQARLPL
jgi:hypothetical protein